jgi:hypothetical protein
MDEDQIVHGMRETAGNGICAKPGRDLDRFSCRDTEGGVARRVKDVGEKQGYAIM